MKYLVLLLVLSSLLIISCSDNNAPGPVSSLSGETPSPLAKGGTKISCPNKVKYASKTYNTILIGSQCWLKENLDVGTQVTGSPFTWQSNNGVIEKFCYNDDPANCSLYGGLYMWDEAMQYSVTPGTRGICPMGWHIPTVSDFQVLGATVNNDGNSLKAIGQGTGTNTSGFSALLAGVNYGETFSALNDYAAFWSSTGVPYPGAATALLLYGSHGYFDIHDGDNLAGLSIRCLKD